MSGTRPERCVKPWLTHNVSNTISVRSNEWDEVADFIYNNRKYFCGVSLISIDGDKDYPQAPFSAIYTPVEIAKMYGDGSLMASGLIVDALYAFDNNLWKACDAVLGRGEPIIEAVDDNEDKIFTSKKDWVRRAKQFADRYFGGDEKNMTYCLKDVANWKYWCDLNREYKEVDYSEMIEEKDNTKAMQEWACSGPNGCELNFIPKAS